ncbi:MAG: leucine-rich repeat domain-containing protein [Vicingaceae bacterium]|nr:leucine-rich repeat domain-containing protein [Vicingaceae bacterium]
MKNIFKIIIVWVLFLFQINEMKAQNFSDTSQVKKEYNSLDEALRNPNNVYRLNLSNQKLTLLSDSIWGKFENLEFLSLKNDHLKEIPSEIGKLKNLKVLDLSGNDFRVLPASFTKLNSLIELYLNDESYMDVNRSLTNIKDLPNLKILHLENDHLEKVPENLFKLIHLEKLYLNKNSFKKIPIELKEMNTLNYIDMHDNQFDLNLQNPELQGFGIKIDL